MHNHSVKMTSDARDEFVPPSVAYQDPGEPCARILNIVTRRCATKARSVFMHMDMNCTPRACCTSQTALGSMLVIPLAVGGLNTDTQFHTVLT